MDLQDFINKRLNLNCLQQTTLIDLLGFRQSIKTRENIKALVKNKFYSSFDNKEFSKDFIVTEDGISYKGSKLKEVRKTLLENLEKN